MCSEFYALVSLADFCLLLTDKLLVFLLYYGKENILLNWNRTNPGEFI